VFYCKTNVSALEFLTEKDLAQGFFGQFFVVLNVHACMEKGKCSTFLFFYVFNFSSFRWAQAEE